MYKYSDIEKAVAEYKKIKHYGKTVEKLGYPTISVLWQWVHGNIPKRYKENKKTANKIK